MNLKDYAEVAAILLAVLLVPASVYRLTIFLILLLALMGLIVVIV